MVSFAEDIDGKLTCPRLWSSDKSAFRGSCTSEPSRGGVTKTAGVGRRRSRDGTRGELFRRQILQRAVWAYRVVIHPPVLDHLPCVSEIHETVLIQAFIAELPVEAFDKRVLRGLAALDEVQRHLILIGPLIHNASD